MWYYSSRHVNVKFEAVWIRRYSSAQETIVMTNTKKFSYYDKIGVNLPFTGCDVKDPCISRYCRFFLHKSKMTWSLKKTCHSVFWSGLNISRIGIPFLLKGVMGPSNRFAEWLIRQIIILRDLYWERKPQYATDVRRWVYGPLRN